MATQLEISTVAAVKSVQTLRQQTAALTQVIGALSKSIGTLQKKMKNNGDAAKTVSAKMKATAASALKMKNAAFSAGQQFQNLAQKLKLAGASQDKITGLKNSLTALDKKLKAGKLTPLQYAKSMNLWKASMGRARRELVRLKNAEQKQTAAAKAALAATRRLTPVIRRLGVRTRRTERNVSGLSKRLKILGSSAIFAVGPLSGVGARVAAFGAITSKAGVRIALVSLSIAALVIGAIKLAGAMIRTNVVMAQIINSLKVATGSAEGAAREFKFVVETAQDLALNLPVVAVQFAQLAAAARGTTLEGEGVRKIFTAMSKASLVLSLSADQTRGAFRALQQMISKGTVQAEELRGQLGERLPGAFQIAARAMGVTTRELGKLMEQGLIRASELLPKLAEEMEKTFDPQVADAIDTWTAATNKLATAWFRFLDGLEERSGTVKFLQKVVAEMANQLDLAADALNGTKRFNEELARLNAELAINEISLRKATTAQREKIKFTIQERLELALLRGEQTRLLAARAKLIQSDTSGPIQNFPQQPPLSNQQFLDLPVTSVDKFRDSIVGLNKVMRVLSDESIDLEKRLDLQDSLNRTARAVKSVNKVMKGLSENEQFALRLQFTPANKGVITLKQLRGVLLQLIIDESNLQNATKDATQELRRQMKAAERLQLSFDKLVLKLETTNEAMERAFSGDVIGSQFATSLGKARQILLKFSDEAIANFARVNNVISQQSFDLFKESSGTEKAQAFADILTIVEQRMAGLIQSTRDAESMAQVFADTRTETELLNMEMEKLNHLLDRFGDQPEKVEAIKRAMADLDPFLNSISEGIQRMGSDLAGAIRSGENLFDTLKNSFANLLEMLLDLAIQLLIIKPLLASLSLPGGSASPLSILGLPTNLLGLPSAKGNAFSGGNVVPFRKGGVVSSPSNFSFGGGIGSIAEQGAEGILPLKRTSSGNLGVEAVGAGGGTTVNFFLAPGESVREFNESQPEIAAMMQGTMSSAAASNG